MDSQSLSTPLKDVYWTVSIPPQVEGGYFEVQVTNSADTRFISASSMTRVWHKPTVSDYQASIGPFTKLNQRYLYRVVNNKTYTSVSGSTLTTTAASQTNKFDTFNASLKSY